MKALQFNVTPARFLAAKTLRTFFGPRVFYQGPARTIRLTDISDPVLPSPDWVKIETTYCGFCGSDLNLILLHDSPTASPFTSFPCVPGHEVVGRVIQTGEAVRGFHPGERVVVNPTLSCITRGIEPVCRSCRAGRPGNCENYAEGRLPPGMFIGINSSINGGFAPCLVAHQHQLTRVPDFVSNEAAISTIARLLPEQASLLAGVPRRPFATSLQDNSAPPHNSVVAIDTEGEVVASYDKSPLVPFGEYLPFGEFFALLGIRQFVPGADGWSPGDVKRRLLNLPAAPAPLVLVCYEIIFSGDLGDTAGAQFLLNLTNDAWFDGSVGPAQHAHHARLRAVEEGMSLVRAANTGLTFATDPLGRVTTALAPGEMAVLDVRPHERLAGTVFQSVRHWPVLIAVLAGILAGFVASRRGRRRRPE